MEMNVIPIYLYGMSFSADSESYDLSAIRRRPS